ncbi:MAG: DUF481 domain-containing protein [Pseudomonadota bacterium]|nr:DUF481 domain-containing protein [Pseudomonadota bacterium]
MPHAFASPRLLAALPLLALAFSVRAEEPVWPPPAAPDPAPPAAPAAPAAPTAAEPWGAGPAVPTANDPWGVGAAPAATVPAATTLAPTPEWAPPVSAARETRETWNSAGHIVRRLTFDQGLLQAETSFTYDEAGRVLEERSAGPGGVVVQTWTYNKDDTPVTHTIVTDGQPQLHEVYTYVGGKVTSRAVTTPNGTSVTTTSYGPNGQPTLVETRGVDGALLARTVSDREPALPTRVKLNVGINGGIATNSDVRTTSIIGGFLISRKPTVDQYEYDPIELSAFGTYNRATSEGELTNDQLKAGVGMDYNNLVGPLTAFLFTNVERNPVANLDVDLYVAPIGVKYDIVPEGLFTLDASFAPVWNFRSVAVAAGGDCDGLSLVEDGHCTFSKIRGSFRVRASLGTAAVTLKDVVEFLPTLNPKGDFGAAIEDEAIFRNTTTLSVKITNALTLSESVVFVRDPLLAAQVDCAADPDNLLCDGMSLQTGTTLALSYAF